MLASEASLRPSVRLFVDLRGRTFLTVSLNRRIDPLCLINLLTAAQIPTKLLFTIRTLEMCQTLGKASFLG
jgi:hypothetical protein